MYLSLHLSYSVETQGVRTHGLDEGVSEAQSPTFSRSISRRKSVSTTTAQAATLSPRLCLRECTPGNTESRFVFCNGRGACGGIVRVVGAAVHARNHRQSIQLESRGRRVAASWSWAIGIAAVVAGAALEDGLIAGVATIWEL